MAAITTGDVALVGRAGQLELMINSLRGRAKPSFVIAGAAGIGKTRMAAEVAKAAGSAGYSLAHVVATRTAASIPFGAFAPLLPLLRAEEGGLVGLLQAATHALLDNTAGDRPLLLVVDDAQLLDEGSATLLHQLAQQDACSLVASVRVPSRVPDSITSLWKEGIAERIDLLPLDEHEVEQLARIVIGGPVSGPTRHWLYETSKGNPLYARELIRGAVEGGSLTEARGVWTLHFPWHAPERLVELVAARLSELAPPTREAVELLALAEPLGFELLESITEPGALEAGEREGLIVARVEGRRSVVGLVHPLYAEVLRQGIGVVRHRRLAHILAEAVIERGMRRHDDLLRVARWQLDSGKRGEAELLLRAASRAREMFDLQLMGRLARAALDAGAGAAAGRLVGEALYSTGRHDEAERFLAEQATRCVSDDERAEIARARLYNLVSRMGDRARGLAVVDDALAEISDPTARAVLLSQVVVTKVVDRDFSGGLAAGRELLESEDPKLRLLASYPLAMALAALGRAEAVGMANAAYEEQRSLGIGRTPERQLTGAVLGLAATGRLAEAEEVATRIYERAVAIGNLDLVSNFCILRGLVLVEVGRLAEAALSFSEGAAIDREVDDPLNLHWNLGGMALAWGMAGNAELAASAREELDESPADCGLLFDSDLVDRARAWERAAAGETTKARAMLRAAADGAAERGEPVAEARLLHDLVRLGDPLPVAERLLQLAGVVDGQLVSAFAGHASARVAGDGTQILAAAEALEHTGALLVAAEAYEAAATSLVSEGLSRKASGAERRGSELRESIGFAGSLGMPSQTDLSQLTRRELEVATLAAAGAPSSAIAGRLFLSVRTVDNHLQHVYTKLGVSKRDELTALLRPRQAGLDVST